MTDFVVCLFVTGFASCSEVRVQKKRSATKSRICFLAPFTHAAGMLTSPG
jgi:hypothetical protein